MKKLSLKLDDLMVESFTTADFDRYSGTVNARSETAFTENNSCIACGGTNQATQCGGELCGGGGGGPTVMISCDDTSTMNDLVSHCMTASLAGPSCEAMYGETCGSLCTA